ncbi:hypothetical protein QJQ45_004237 [Haematococcus lacustris]|nr:hypothetical protein QJQ45_004237 [Haematococcus lacustris]
MQHLQIVGPANKGFQVFSSSTARCDQPECSSRSIATSSCLPAPSIAAVQTLPAVRTAALSPFPPTAPSGPLTVQYPTQIEYYKDREAVVFNMDSQPCSVVLLPGDVFNVPVRIDVLHRTVRWLRAMWRQGTHKAKSRAEVSGGGRKPWPQKGTGRARHGSIRSPIWVGGGASHGPVPRSHAHGLPLQLQLLAYKCALSAKAHEGRLLVVDSLQPPATRVDPLGRRVVHKTRDARRQLQALVQPVLRFWQEPRGCSHMTRAGLVVERHKERCSGSLLMVHCGEGGPDGAAAITQAARNLPWVSLMAWQDVTVYHLLKHSMLVISQPAAAALAHRIQHPLLQQPGQQVRAQWWQQHRESYGRELQLLMGQAPTQPQPTSLTLAPGLGL